MYKKNKLPNDRIDLLNQYGFRWKIQEHRKSENIKAIAKKEKQKDILNRLHAANEELRTNLMEFNNIRDISNKEFVVLMVEELTRRFDKDAEAIAKIQDRYQSFSEIIEEEEQYRKVV